MKIYKVLERLILAQQLDVYEIMSMGSGSITKSTLLYMCTLDECELYAQLTK